MIVRLADILWDRLPRRAERWSGLLSAALLDGSEIRRWPKLAMALPAAALVAGLVVGIARPASDDTYTYSVLWVGPLIAAATLGAAIGLWAWAGYAIGDFFFYHHFQWISDPLGHLWQEMVPLFLIGNLVLFALLVAMPLAVSDLRRRALGPIRDPRAQFAMGVVVRVAATVLLTTIWVSSARLLIRPLFLWRAPAAPPTAIGSLTANLVVLLVIALAGSIAREVIVLSAPRESTLAGSRATESLSTVVPLRSQACSRAFVRSLRVVLIAGLTTLGLAGLTEDLGGLALLFGALLGAWVIRQAVLPRVPAYVRLVTAVPLVARLVIVAIVAGVIGRWLLDAPYGLVPVSQSFTGITLPVVASILVAALLLPSQNPPAHKESIP